MFLLLQDVADEHVLATGSVSYSDSFNKMQMHLIRIQCKNYDEAKASLIVRDGEILLI